MGDHHAAADLVQAALERTARHWRRIADSGDPDGYVRRVMVNQRTSWWRRHRAPGQWPPVEGDPRLAVALGDATAGQVTQRAPLLPGASMPFYLNSQVAYGAQTDRSAPVELYAIASDGTSVLLSRLPAQAEYVLAGMRFALLGEAYADLMAS